MAIAPLLESVSLSFSQWLYWSKPCLIIFLKSDINILNLHLQKLGNHWPGYLSSKEHRERRQTSFKETLVGSTLINTKLKLQCSQPFTSCHDSICHKGSFPNFYLWILNDILEIRLNKIKFVLGQMHASGFLKYAPICIFYSEGNLKWRMHNEGSRHMIWMSLGNKKDLIFQALCYFNGLGMH